MQKPLEFFPVAMNVWNNGGWVKDAYKILAYQGQGVNFPVEGIKAGGGYWNKQEAEAAAAQANAGNEAGIVFAAFADD